MTERRVQVAILGAGPAGLLLSHLLARRGISCAVLEIRTREHVLSRIRAGVLEQGTVDVLSASGLGDRAKREGFVHEGVVLATEGRSFRVDFRGLTGSAVTIYGQTELQKDLFAAADARDALVLDRVSDVALDGITGKRPRVTFERDGQRQVIDADFVAGCDGHHGVSRTAIPAELVRVFERTYPFAWLGILAEVPPVGDELVYAEHERGFALCSMRNPMLSRYYVQCDVGERVETWTDARFWDELRRRLPPEVGGRVVTGPSIEKSMTPLRSYISEPMRHGRLFLAGDAAHIVPPTGAKGLNLAVSDVALLSEAIAAHYEHGTDEELDAYSSRALERVWSAVRFSWWMTTLMHRFPTDDAFSIRLRHAELAHLERSEAARRALAESYVGLARS